MNLRRSRDDIWHCVHHRELDEAQRDNAKLRATLARIEALCGMNHDESLVEYGRVRAALRGEP